MEEEKPFYRIINEICEEKNINQKLLSYGWIRELKKKNESHYIIRYQFDLNSAVSYRIAKDKFATYEVLKSNNIPIIEHKMIFNPEKRSEYYENEFIEDAKRLLLKNNNKVVIKANGSCEGKEVYYCTTENEIENIVNKLFEEKKSTLSACPYMEIDFEYRAIYLCGEILYIYKKRKPYVIGDGKNTLQELIDKKNNDNDIQIDVSKEIDLQYVPKNKEEVTISWKHNLSNGAEPVVIDGADKFVDKIEKIALNVGNALNIEFASIDIAQTKNNEIFVMEVNGSVCMNKFAEIVPNGYEIAKNIYSKAIDKMFE